jgi:glycerophosphoryl diester phosphodiesterase
MYGAGVGPDKKFLTEEWTKINNGASFIGECHKRGMYVHPWVLRNDELYFTENAIDENIWYINAQVDGLFTEFPETTFAVFEQYAQSKQGHKMFK